MRKKEKVQQGQERSVSGIGDSLTHGSSAPAKEGASNAEYGLHNHWKEEQQERNDCPVHRSTRKPEPSGDEQDECEGLDQRTPEVVEDLPARNRRDWVRHQPVRFVGNAGKHPLSNLPITSYPAMFAARVGAVVRGIIVDEFDICDQANARICAFDEIVAEKGIAWEASI